MSNHRTAELIGAHMAMSTPLAHAWHRVAHGALAPPSDEQGMRLILPEVRAREAWVDDGR